MVTAFGKALGGQEGVSSITLTGWQDGPLSLPKTCGLYLQGTAVLTSLAGLILSLHGPFIFAVILQFGTMPPRFSTLSKGSKHVGVEFCSVSIESGGKNENVAVLLHLVNFAHVCVPFSSDAAA